MVNTVSRETSIWRPRVLNPQVMLSHASGHSLVFSVSYHWHSFVVLYIFEYLWFSLNRAEKDFTDDSVQSTRLFPRDHLRTGTWKKKLRWCPPPYSASSFSPSLLAPYLIFASHFPKSLYPCNFEVWPAKGFKERGGKKEIDCSLPTMTGRRISRALQDRLERGRKRAGGGIAPLPLGLCMWSS